MNGKKFGLLLGAVLFIIMLIMPPPEGLKIEAWRMAAITVLMAVWWITEAMPIPATSLLPIVLFPLLKVMPAKEATLSYADETIYLFMGGFFLAAAMEHWNLHRRVALYTVKIVGVSPSHMVLGFMLAVAFLSMGISNTATAVMMVPIGIAVISQITGLTAKDIHDSKNPQAANFAKSLMLGIAYAASIGGIATLIGTPPNTIMKGIVLKTYGYDISFAKWFAFGFPLAAVLIAFTWILLVKVLFPSGDLKLAGSRELISEELKKLGAMSRAEKSIAIVGILMALMWIARGFIPKGAIPAISLISDTTIAIFGTMLLFLIPVDFKKGVHILEWSTAVKIPWDIVLLFGGGITLASGFQKTGLAAWLSGQLAHISVSLIVMILIIALLTTFLTEVTSNTATATLLIPIMGAAAIALKVHPLAFIVTSTVSASFAFMLPVATPPNAVVFGSRYLLIKDMARAGVVLNLLGAVFITVFVYFLLPKIWGIDLSVTPQEFIDAAEAAIAK